MMKAVPLVLARGDLRSPAIVGQGQPDIRRLGRGIDLHADSRRRPRETHADLFPRPGAADLQRRPPFVVAHKLRDAIDYHLRRVRSVDAESAGVSFLPLGVSMSTERVAPPEVVPIIH